MSLSVEAVVSVESHLISVEGAMKLENHHLSALIIIDSGKKTSMDATKKWIKV